MIRWLRIAAASFRCNLWLLGRCFTLAQWFDPLCETWIRQNGRVVLVAAIGPSPLQSHSIRRVFYLEAP